MVASARRTLGIRRVGHTGTLDPFASGLLLRGPHLLTGADEVAHQPRFSPGELVHGPHRKRRPLQLADARGDRSLSFLAKATG
jgi:hypothetical protein